MRINKSLITYTPSSGAGSGTVTSVAMSVPTGFVVTGSPITSSGTLSVAFASGYSLPTDARQATWDAKMNNPFTTLGDIVYSNASGAAVRRAGNTDAVTKFLSQTGDGFGNSAAPQWLEITSTTIGAVPTTRTLTINGTSYDLSANRTWNVGTVTSVAASAGTGISISGSPITSSGTLTITNTAPDQVVALTAGTGISISGTYPNFTITNSSPSSGGTVTSVALTVPTGLTITGSPITTSGTLAISLQSGYSIPTTASQANWDTAYTNRITSLTTTGSSGAATLVSNVLNIPNYTLSGLGGVPSTRTLTINGTAYDLSADRSWSVGTVTSVAATAGTGISISGSPITSSGTLTITNTAPDQVVALTAGTGISISGTYPNFTITNSSPSSGGTITGSGTTGYLARFTGSSSIGNGIVYDNGTNIISVGEGGSNGEYAIKIGQNRSGNGYAYIDLIGDTTYTGYGARFIRYNTGANAITYLEHQGTGPMIFKTVHSAAIQFETGATYRGQILSNGRLLWNTNSDNGIGTIQINGSGYFYDNVRFVNLKGVVFETTGGSALGSVAMDSSNRVSVDNNGHNLSVSTDHIMTSGNLGIGQGGSVFGGGTKVISMVNATAPSSSPTDSFLQYSADITAGNAAPHFRTENGAIVKLYQQTTGVGSATYIGGGGTTVTDTDTFDGYTIPQIVKALRNAGFLQ